MSEHLEERTAPALSDSGDDFVNHDEVGARGIAIADKEAPGFPGLVVKLPAIAANVPSSAPNCATPGGAYDLVHAIESLSQEAALARIDELRGKLASTYFELGGVLSVIRRNKWFAPHPSFRVFVQNEFGKEYRTALYFVKIYEKTMKLGLSSAQLEGIGWTKARALIAILTVENRSAGLAWRANIAEPSC